MDYVSMMAPVIINPGDLWMDLNGLLCRWDGMTWIQVGVLEQPKTVLTKEQFETWAMEVLHGKR